MNGKNENGREEFDANEKKGGGGAEMTWMGLGNRWGRGVDRKVSGSGWGRK
jgi:hypothetical protein